MGICLEEIRRCRQVSPALNFLVLLGDRFGWKPIPAEIDAGDFERLCAASPDDWEELRRAYRRDDNRDTSRKGILRTIRSSEGLSENRGEIGIRLRKLVVCQV